MAQRSTIYMPVVAGKTRPEPPTLYEIAQQNRQDLLRLLQDDSRQQRPILESHPLLMEAAQDKSDQMANGHWFDHISPSGETPNELVRRHGYKLPGCYAYRDNNVESLAINYQVIGEVMAAFTGSPGHRAHIFGEIDFFREQSRIGVGVTRRYRSAVEDSVYWTVLIAHEEES